MSLSSLLKHPLLAAMGLFLLVFLLRPEFAEARSRRGQRLAQAKKQKGRSARSEPPAAPTSRGPSRLDFDEALIQGQRNRSGTVYLYERQELSLEALAGPRGQFRDAILGAAEAL